MNGRHPRESDNNAGSLLSAVYRALCDSRLAMSLAQQAFSEHEQLNGLPSTPVRNARASILVAERSLREAMQAINHKRELAAAEAAGQSEGVLHFDAVQQLLNASSEPAAANNSALRMPQQGGIE